MKVVWFLALLISASSTEAGLFDYWGYRAGGVKVVDGDFGYLEHPPRMWGGQAGLVGGFELNDDARLCLQTEAALRLSFREQNVSVDLDWPGVSNTYAFEFVLAPSLVYSFVSLKPSPFLLVGVESNLQFPGNHALIGSSTDRWRDLTASLNLGGGLAFPIGNNSLVADLRYNLDLVDQYAPEDLLVDEEPAKFNELHLLIGINFNK